MLSFWTLNASIVSVQIATPESAFILDFKALVSSQRNKNDGTKRGGGRRGDRGNGRIVDSSGTDRRDHAGESSPSPSDPSPSLLQLTECFLHNLLSDRNILKVGWGFYHEDIKALRSIAGGKSKWPALYRAERVG